MPPASPTPNPNPPALVLPLALATLQGIMRQAPSKFLFPLNAAMGKYEINTGKCVAGFLAQLAVESNQLRHTHELWTSKKNFQLTGVNRPPHTATSQKDYFEYWYGNRQDLGNITAEDGYTYRGRGAIQITGRDNYRRIGIGIGQPLETNPDLLATSDAVDMLASAYFFAALKGLNPVADGVDPGDQQSISDVNRKLTKAINGGFNGLAERLQFFKKGLAALAE
jgi:putative chitinase